MQTNPPAPSEEASFGETDLMVSKSDLNGRITYVNDRFLEISGFAEAELIGQPQGVTHHPDMPAEVLADLEADLKAGRPWIGLIKHRHRNDRPYWLEAHTSPLWEGGQVIGYISVGRRPAAERVEAAEAAYQALREGRGGRRIRHGQIVRTGLFARWQRRTRDLPISVRFLLPSILALAAVMAATVYLVGRQITETLTAAGESELVERIRLVHSMMESTVEAVEHEASRLLDFYAARYPGAFAVEAGADGIPVLRHERTAVNGHHDEEDAFARVARGPTASILVRRGDEFVRIATSQKNEKGERVIHTILDKDSPAVARLLAGETYIGRTTSQGKDRVSALKPIKDANGQVIGAFGIGYFITQEMSVLRERIKAVKVGETGYVYVIDAQPGKRQGTLIVHPAKEGENVIASKDASGHEFIREMVERQEGVIRYPWKNGELGDAREKQKVVAFRTLKRWNLLIGGGTYEDEFDQVSRKLYFGLIGASLLAILCLAVVIAWLSRQVIARRLNQVLEALRALSTGRYDSAIDIGANDELGRIQQGLESMQNRLGFEVLETRRQADAMTRIKIGLDNVATNVRIADNDGRILYINKALQETLRSDAPFFRSHDPAFDPERMIGYNVGHFYSEPAAALQRLRHLSQSEQTQMRLGSRTYRVTTTPVINERGERLGSAGEWLDITDQMKAQELLTEVIRKAAGGDFSVRLGLDSRDPFFVQVEQLINQLLSNGENALGELSEVLSAISAGDLTAGIASDYQGVFGRLKEDTNMTVERLKAVVAQIKEATDAINVASREIAAGSHDLSSRTEQQASNLEQTSGTMEEINSTVRQNAESARQATELAGRSNQIATRGGRMVKEIVTTMSEIQSSSRRIADIIGVIDGIAFQTNILALNAAVEAARAGEQGRGFAVVATEVRNLALRSATASKEIRGLITESVRKVDEGVALVEDAGITMDDVVKSFERVSTLVTDISHASSGQSTGIEQMTRAVNQMDEVTQQNAALVEQAAAAAESLEEQAQVLARTVGQFTLVQR